MQQKGEPRKELPFLLICRALPCTRKGAHPLAPIYTSAACAAAMRAVGTR